MRQADVTVLIATRNRFDLLSACLDSLQAQVLPPGLEARARVVDNGSTDGSYERLVAWAAAPRPLPVEVLRQPRPGKSAALNLGLQGLTEGIVAFTDDDMRLDPAWIASIWSHFRDCTCGGLNGQVQIELLGPAPPWFTETCAELLGATVGRTDGEPVTALQGGNMAVRARLLDLVGPFREDMGPRFGRFRSAEDVEWSRRLLQRGQRLCYCAAALDHHRVAASRLSRWALFWRQLEYARREVVEGHVVVEHGWLALAAELRSLLGALLRPRRVFRGFDRGLEIARRCGHAVGRLDRLLGAAPLRGG